MYSIDERLRGLPAVKDQVVQLYQSLNAPHLAIPGRKAGPATAFVLGLRGPSGFAVFVYLYMQQSGESAVYVPSSGTVPAEKFQGEEAEALGFVESMGFIMDNLNFRGRPPDEQDAIIRTMPVFMREPPPPAAAPPSAANATAGGKPGTGGHASVLQLGKLFSAFCLALLFGTGCAHVSDAARDQSRIHYELALAALVKSPQESMKECDAALELNPENAEAWHIKALLLHHSYQRLDEALTAYLKAISLKEPFSEARTNVGNLYMDQKRYDDAIVSYQKALDDVLYPDTFIAQGNMGWAYFKTGNTKQAIDLLKSATTVNPKYCLGYLQLGQVYEAQQNSAESCKYFGRFREHCPDRPDAWQREAICLANAGDKEGAGKAFDNCVAKSGSDDQKDLCKSLKAELLK
ncbi:MAG: social motility TPR repeat lipoprotein Tgl [Myxococcaceae bacterium]